MGVCAFGTWAVSVPVMVAMVQLPIMLKLKWPVTEPGWRQQAKSFCLIGVCTLICLRTSLWDTRSLPKESPLCTCVPYSHHSCPANYFLGHLLIFLLPSPWLATWVVLHSLWVCIYLDLRPLLIPHSSSPSFTFHFMLSSPQPAPLLVLVTCLVWWPDT